RELAQTNDGLHLALAGLDGAQLLLQADFHEIGKRYGELAPELLAQHAVGDEGRNASRGRNDHDPALDRERANPVHDRETAGLLDVYQVAADADACHDRGQHAGTGAGKLVDVTREMGEISGLAPHHLDHRGLRPLHQLDLPGHADGVEENAEIHRARIVGRHDPALDLPDEVVHWLRPLWIADHHVARTRGEAEP